MNDKSSMDKTVGDHLKFIATQLVNELTPILAIKGLTSNTALLGDYTEAAVTGLVRRVVYPMRVSTGAVVDYPISDPLRQIDLIVWAPFPAPAFFEVENFGLVPKSSAFGVIEIKRSNYSGVDEHLRDFLADADARRIVSDSGGPIADYQRKPGIAVISVLETKPSNYLQGLFNEQRAVAIFERTDDGGATVRARDVLVLVNHLHFITWRYRVRASAPGYPQLAVDHL